MSFFASLTTRRSLPFEPLLKSLHGNFFLSIFLRGVTAILALAANVVLARVLGVTEYGRYMTLYSAAIVLGSLAVRGTDQFLTREIAAGTIREPAVRGLLARWSGKRVAVGVGAAVAIYLIWSVFGPASLAGPYRWTAGIAVLLLIALCAACATLAGILNGFGASQRSQSLVPLFNNGVVLLAIAGLWLATVKTIDSTVALWLQACGYLLACMVGWYWWRSCVHADAHHVRTTPAQSTLVTPSRRWGQVSRNFLFISVAAIVTNRLDVVLVSMLGGNRAAGIYVAGARLAQIALLVAMSVNTVLSPRISRAWHDGDYAKTKRLLCSGLVFTISVSIVEVFLAIFFGSDIIKIFGSPYSESTAVFVSVVVAYALWTVGAPAYALLSMTGSERVVAGLSWFIAFVNVVAIGILVPVYGAIGGGWAMVAGFLLALPILIVVVWRRAKLSVHAS